jgi:hypothetical protein
VVAAELLEKRHEVVRAIDHLHDVHERAEQPAALHLHVDREQVTGLGGAAEQHAVEVPAQLLGVWLHDSEGPADDLDYPRLGAAGLSDRREVGREQLFSGHRSVHPFGDGGVTPGQARFIRVARCNLHVTPRYR